MRMNRMMAMLLTMLLLGLLMLLSTGEFDQGLTNISETIAILP